MPEIQVNLFGELTVRAGENCIRETDSRQRKVWLLLAYLLFHHDRIVKPAELLGVIWSEEECEAASPGAIKTLLYRLRRELERLYKGAGKQLILHIDGGYCWNGDVAMHMDTEEFSRRCEALADGEDPGLAAGLLGLYRGEFLASFSSEFWVTPHAVYFHNLYMDLLLRTLPELEAAGQHEDILQLCRKAAAVEPFHEEIHCRLMAACIALKKYKEAMEVYTRLRDRFQSELGIVPSDETRAYYAEAARCGAQSALTAEVLRESLNEKDSRLGALICDFDFFRVLYQSMARSVMRSGIAVHLALVTMKGIRVAESDEKRWEKLRLALEDAIRCSLRRGDSATACSNSQFVFMLPHANYENTEKVCARIASAYHKKVSRLELGLNFEVFPIEPDDKENLQWIR